MVCRYSGIVILLAAMCLQQVVGHSWIACTDYIEKNGRYYDHEKCRGYPRSGKRFTKRGGQFGADLGFNFHPQESQPCKTDRNDATQYDAVHPMAVYYPGQQVVLAHPMKNHGFCTNANIPDALNIIYRGERDALSDSTLSEFRKNQVADLGAKDDSPADVYPKQGYQNAPAFCENQDKSLGTYSFNVPKDIAPGRYTFVWLWGFNGVADLYSTCWEVDIVPNSGLRNAQLMSNGFNDFYEPCGGKTSNFDVPGNSNPGCTDGNGGITPPATKTARTSGPTLPTPISTTPKPLTTRPTLAPGEVKVATQTFHISGVAELPIAQPGTNRRIIDVFSPCPVDMTFADAIVDSKQLLPGAGVRYRLFQEGGEIALRRVFYFARFNGPCDLEANQQVIKFVIDENRG